MGILASLFGSKPMTLREELTRPSPPEIPKEQRVRGEFYEDKFFEDQVILNEIKEKMGKGYFNENLIGTILNVSKIGVERLLKDCEEAVEYYSNGNEGILIEYTQEQRVKFFKECVTLRKEQLEGIERR